MKRKIAAILFLSALQISTASGLWARGTKESPLVNGNFFALGTTCTISIYGGTEEQFSAIENLIVDIENRMSVRIASSEVSRVNSSAGLRAEPVSPDVFKVISAGIRFSELSSGAFDISIGPLVSLWDIGGSGNSVPTEELIAATLTLIDYKTVKLEQNGTGGKIYLSKPGMALEPGGIAKGYAADAAALYLKKEGVDSALINLGGNVLAIGTKSDGSRWRIGVQNPDSSRGDYIGVIPVTDNAVVTSGKYERYFIADDQRYHHILSTKDGYPVENSIAQVTIISAESMTADAMSTTVFSLGLESGLELAERMDEVEAVIVMESGDIYLTAGLRDVFKLTDSSFQITD